MAFDPRWHSPGRVATVCDARAFHDEQFIPIPARPAADDIKQPDRPKLAEALVAMGARAALVTVMIAFGSMCIALILGMPLAMGQSKGPPWLRWLCTVYIEFFRGTPVLVQLLFLYFGLPTIGLAMPGSLTALLGLGLNYAAYESQVYRAALEAIPRGQWEASYLLGIRCWLFVASFCRRRFASRCRR